MSSRALVDWLANQVDNQRVLAVLRRGLREHAWGERHILPLVPKGKDPAPYRLVASLFALHPTDPSVQGVRIGEMFCTVVEKDPRKAATMEVYVTHLLNARHDLDHKLQRIVMLARQEKIALDWWDTAAAVLDWEGEAGERARRQWASDYWGHIPR